MIESTCIRDNPVPGVRLSSRCIIGDSIYLSISQLPLSLLCQVWHKYVDIFLIGVKSEAFDVFVCAS